VSIEATMIGVVRMESTRDDEELRLCATHHNMRYGNGDEGVTGESDEEE